jgi:hypothetical protein
MFFPSKLTQDIRENVNKDNHMFTYTETTITTYPAENNVAKNVVNNPPSEPEVNDPEWEDDESDEQENNLLRWAATFILAILVGSGLGVLILTLA